MSEERGGRQGRGGKGGDKGGQGQRRTFFRRRRVCNGTGDADDDASLYARAIHGSDPP